MKRKKLLKNPSIIYHDNIQKKVYQKGKYEITVDKKVVFDAMKKDLTAIQRLWKEA